MKKKLEEHKSQRENFINVEKGLLDEIGKLKTFNASLNEKVGSLQSQTGAEDASVLREELDAQKKKVLDMDVENKKIAKEKETKERSLILVNSQCFALKEELHKLKKDQSFSKESRVSQMSKIKSELAEVQKTSEHYKSAYEKYKSDEASEITILAKEQGIKQLKEALEEEKKNQASSSKRKHGDDNIFYRKRKRNEEPIKDSDQRRQLPTAEVSEDSTEESDLDASSETYFSTESQITDTEPAQNSLFVFY